MASCAGIEPLTPQMRKAGEYEQSFSVSAQKCHLLLNLLEKCQRKSHKFQEDIKLMSFGIGNAPQFL